jgi:hypothetical protein
VAELASKLGLHYYLQTDPRGATIYLDTQEIPENNYTQAVCIYYLNLVPISGREKES